MPLLGMSLNLRKAETTKGAILKAIVLISIAIIHKLALIRLLVILLKGLRLNLVVLRLVVIKSRGSSYLGGCCFRAILIAGDCCSAPGTI